MDRPSPQRPPCREADRCLTACPKCSRAMQARWLKYSHQCGNSWDVQRRGEEHAERAQRAFLARAAPEVATTPAKGKYADLFEGLR